MRKIRTRADFDDLRGAIAARAAAGWAFYEGASALAGIGPEGIELSGGEGEAVLRAVDAGRIWRVVGWEERGDELRLSVRGAFGHIGETLRVAPDGDGPLAWGPDWFEEAVRRALERGWGLDAATLTRRGPRMAGSLRIGHGRRAAVVALAAEGSERDVDDLLAAGLVARDAIEHACSRDVELFIFSTRPALRIFAERLVWLSPDARVRLFDVESATATEVRPHDQGSLADEGSALWPRPELPPSPLSDRVLALAPQLLSRHRRPGSGVDRIALNGLECARLRGGAAPIATFGIGRARRRLDQSTWSEFEGFVGELAHYRSPEAPDRLHPAYRLHTERWLASLLVRDITVVDPLLDPTVVHEQVPARRGDSRDFIDLLAVTRTGRLAVIEVKAAEDRSLPFQGLNYWSRVRWHHARGEIARRGYFPGIELDPRPPLLYLVGPLFRLHASVRLALPLLSPEVEAVAVGLNTAWRAGPRALVRWNGEGRGE